MLHFKTQNVPELDIALEDHVGRFVGLMVRQTQQYVREEEVDRQFKESLKLIQLDADVLKLVIKALKESAQDEKAFREDKVLALQLRHNVIQGRIEAMYTDKLNGKITYDLYERKSEAWRREQIDILREMEAYQNTNRTYYEEGVQILELAQRAVKLYEKQTIEEKRRLLNFVYSNSTFSQGRLSPIFRKPFDLLALTNAEHTKKRPPLASKATLVLFGSPLLMNTELFFYHPMKIVSYFQCLTAQTF